MNNIQTFIFNVYVVLLWGNSLLGTGVIQDKKLWIVLQYWTNVRLLHFRRENICNANCVLIICGDQLGNIVDLQTSIYITRLGTQGIPVEIF